MPAIVQNGIPIGASPVYENGEIKKAINQASKVWIIPSALSIDICDIGAPNVLTYPIEENNGKIYLDVNSGVVYVCDSEWTENQTLVNIQTALETLGTSAVDVDEGVDINFGSGKTFRNNDTEIILTGYIRKDVAHLTVTGWLGADTSQNNTHLHVLVDDAEYAKMFEQFNVNVSVPYNDATGGFRQAIVSVMVGEVVTEYIFKKTATGETVTTFNINDYIDNSAYEWDGVNKYTGVELWWQGMPDVNMADYPLCINASTSCIWEGK